MKIEHAEISMNVNAIPHASIFARILKEGLHCDFIDIQLEYKFFSYFHFPRLASSASALMALSFPMKMENVSMSMSVDWRFTIALTNASIRKEVTVVHAPKTWNSQAMANVANIKIFVNMIMVDAVRSVRFIIIKRFARVEKDLKSMKMRVLNAMISMNVALSTSE